MLPGFCISPGQGPTQFGWLLPPLLPLPSLPQDCFKASRVEWQEIGHLSVAPGSGEQCLGIPRARLFQGSWGYKFSPISQGLASLVQDTPSPSGASEARGLQATVAQIEMQSL